MRCLATLLLGTHLLALASLAHAQTVDLLSTPVIPPTAREGFLFLEVDNAVGDTPEAPTNTETRPSATVLSDGEDFTGEQKITTKTLDIGIKAHGAAFEDTLYVDPSLWRESNRFKLKNTLNALHGSADTPLNMLLRDLLLAEAFLPREMTVQEFLSLRAGALARSGMIEDAHRLLLSARSLNPENTLLLDQLLIQQYASETLCPRDIRKDGAQEYALRIYCLLEAKKLQDASLQAQLMQELFPDTTSQNYLLLTRLAFIDEPRLPLGETLMPDPTTIIIAESAGVTPYFAAHQTLPPDVAHMLLDQPNYPIDQRLQLAETAYFAGFADKNDVRRIQNAQIFAVNEYKNAAQLMQQFPSERSRALGLQVLWDSPDKSDLELVLAALAHGDDTNHYLMMVDLLSDELYAWQDNPSLALARANLALGRFGASRQTLPKSPKTANHWLMRQILFPNTAKIPPGDSNAFLQSLILEEGEAATSTESNAPQQVDSWQDWSTAMQDYPAQRDLILVLLSSLGVKTNLADVPTPTEGTVIVDGLRLLEFQQALRTPLADSNPPKIAEALSGLRQMGYAEIAKAQAARLLAMLMPQDL